MQLAGFNFQNSQHSSDYTSKATSRGAKEKKVKEGEPAPSWPDQSGRPTYIKDPAQRQRLPVNYEDCADNSHKNISTILHGQPEEKIFRLLRLQHRRL
jgi:hypothetical protein